LVGIEIHSDSHFEYSPEHMLIYLDNEEVGKITSSAYSPRLDKNIALGIIKKRKDKVNQIYSLRKNKKELNILVCDLPFLRNK